MEFVTNSFASFVLVRLALPATGCQPPSTCGPVRTAHNAPHPAAPAAAAVLHALILSPSTYLLALPALATWLSKALAAREASIAYYKEVKNVDLEKIA
jgi:hypothetical protein